ncbi:MAG: sulfurtransferase TusA family protein [Armatimonadetes bacterium]|nr:sulfurtransferase TusA family protein [Armatimonadota bacterium]
MEEQARRVNCLGMKCPHPLLAIHQFLRDLKQGERIEAISDDPAFEANLRAWCETTGQILLSVEARDGVFAALLERAQVFR